MNHPDMPPEVFVRLRLHGLTTEGMWAIAKTFKQYNAWEYLVRFMDESDNPGDIAANWNRCAQEMKADGRLD